MLYQVHDDTRPSYVLVLCLIFLMLLSASCSSLVTSRQGGGATEYSDRCVPLVAKRAQHGVEVSASSSEVTISASPLAETRYSFDALRVADNIGVVSLLNDIAEFTAQGKRESVEVLVRRQ